MVDMPMRTMNGQFTTCNELPTLVRYHSSSIRPEVLHMLFVKHYSCRELLISYYHKFQLTVRPL